MKDTTEEVMESAARAAMGAVPWIGTALNEAFFECRSRIKLKRFEAFVSALSDDVAKLQEGAIRKGYLRTEEFGDFFEALMLRVVRTRSREKLARLRRVLLKQIQHPSESDFTESFLDIAAQLHEVEITILREHAEGSSADAREKSRGQPFRQPSHYNLERGEYCSMLLDLISRALMFDDSVGRLSTGALGIVEATERGRAFLRFVAESKD